MGKVVKILIVFCLVVCCFIGCEKKSDEKEETENKEDNKVAEQIDLEAIEKDSKTCDVLKSCFNAAMVDDEAYKQVVAGSGEFIILFKEGGITFSGTGNLSAVEKQLEEKILENFEAPNETGKSGYCISWDVENNTVKNIKVETC